MDRISREQFRDTVDEIVERVESGESFIIEHNDVPVAELKPYGGTVSGP